MSEVDLAGRVTQAFERIHRSAFLLDPSNNPKLEVEVVDAGLAGDTPTLILITPWTLYGLAFPPDERFPATIRMSGRDHAAYAIELPEVGAYRWVILAPDVSHLPSAAHARTVARTMAPLFRDAVENVRRELAVRDPSRRRILSGRPARVDVPRGSMGSKAR